MSKDANQYWMPHPTLCYVPADVSSSTSSAIVLSYEGTEKTIMQEDALAVVRSTITQDYSNLERLEDFSEPAILFQIRQRFLKDNIYTYVSNILIAANPYQLLKTKDGSSIYGTNMVKKYEDHLTSGTLDTCDPHVFAVAARAFAGMCQSGKRQSVLISGESGAGKTETTKKVLYFLSSIVRESSEEIEKQHRASSPGGTAGPVADSIEDKMMQSNPILESFGNAQTVMNDNSSRFGKWMEIFFDSVPVRAGKGKVLNNCGNNGWSMLGGAITSYILEKSRVSFQMPGERNFHIFYMLLTSMSEEMRTKFCLPKDSTMTEHYYVKKEGFQTLKGHRNEQNEFNEMMDAFKVLKFEHDAIESLLSVVAAIIHLGDITFEDTPADAVGVKHDADAGPIAKMTTSSLSSLNNAANLLRVDREKLAKTMLVHQTRLFTRPRSPDKSASARDALAKDLYRRLFDSLVEQINVQLGLDGTSRHQIGVLDIFGFEIFDINSFEQLCINYANESLQRHFNTVISDGERAMYTAEGVPFDHMESSIAVDDNRICLDLIGASRMGIMSLLDDQVKHGSRASDTAWLRSMNYAFTKNGSKTFNRCYIKDRIRKDIFTVSHFAGRVTYTIDGFVEKNKDRLPDTMVICMRSSLNVDMATWFANDDVEDVERRMSGGNSKDTKSQAKTRMRATVASKGKRKARGTFRGNIGTLGYKFKDQLKELQTSLDATQPHFARCIKPNSLKFSTHNATPTRDAAFDSNLSLRQLRYSGLFEVIRIRRAGFWFRFAHKDFGTRYRVLAPSVVPQSPEGIRSANWYDVTTKLIATIERNYPDAACNDPRPWAVGKTKVFVRSCQVRAKLEKLRETLMGRFIRRMQSLGRMIIAKRQRGCMQLALQTLDAAMVQMDEQQFQKAVVLCKQYPTLQRHIDTATLKMKELRALIIEREHITKEMKKAVEQRELGALRIAIQNAKEFTIKHPQTSFQLYQPCIELSFLIKTEEDTMNELKRKISNLRDNQNDTNGSGNGLKTALEQAEKLGLHETRPKSDVQWPSWCTLGRALLNIVALVHSKQTPPLHLAVANVEMYEKSIETATLAATTLQNEEGSNTSGTSSTSKTDISNSFSLCQEARILCVQTHDIIEKSTILTDSLNKAVQSRDMGTLKVYVSETVQLLQTVGLNENGVYGIEHVNPLVSTAICQNMSDLLIALNVGRVSIERLSREHEALQKVAFGIRHQDERRLETALNETKALGMHSAEYPDIQKGEEILLRLQKASRLRRRLHELFNERDVGRQYVEIKAILNECSKIKYVTSTTTGLHSEHAALVVQCHFRRVSARKRVAALRSALLNLQQSMEDQDVVKITEHATYIIQLYGRNNGEERKEVKHARYAITFLQNKERVLRDVARAAAMLETSRATTYAMGVMEKCLITASEFNMLDLPRIQKSIEKLANLKRGKRGRDVLRGLLKSTSNGKTIQEVELNAALLRASLIDVGSSEFPTDDALQLHAAHKLQILEQEMTLLYETKQAVMKTEKEQEQVGLNGGDEEEEEEDIVVETYVESVSGDSNAAFDDDDENGFFPSSTRKEKGRIYTNIKTLSNVVERCIVFRQNNRKAVDGVLDLPLHEARTMLKFYCLSAEMNQFDGKKRVKMTQSNGEQTSPNKTTRSHSIASTGSVSPPSLRIGGDNGELEPKYLFLKWCRSMEEAETDEIRLFWLEKLTTLVGGIDILKNACNESVWKRASRRPPASKTLFDRQRRACNDRDTVRMMRKKLTREDKGGRGKEGPSMRERKHHLSPPKNKTRFNSKFNSINRLLEQQPAHKRLTKYEQKIQARIFNLRKQLRNER